jgi:sugar lactone lactonase YvrE
MTMPFTNLTSRRGFSRFADFGFALAAGLWLLGAISALARAQNVVFVGTQVAVPASGLKYPQGAAVDAAGDVFIADSGNNRVVKVTPGGTQTTVGTGLNNPYGVAVDKTGDVFIADSGNSRLVKVPAGGGAQTTAGSGLKYPQGVTLDGSNDVFIADTGNNRIVEVTSSGVQSAVNIGSYMLNGPNGVAVDGAGDVFIADTDNNRVLEVQGGSGGTVIQVPLSLGGVGFTYPSDVVVDGAGDLYVSDYGHGRVVEVEAGGADTVVGNVPNGPGGVALDGAGHVFIVDINDNRVLEVQPVATDFGNVKIQSNSTLTLNYMVLATTTFGATNVVTQGAPNLDFTLGSGSTCTGTVSKEFFGTYCTVNVTFTPLAPGGRMGAARLTDSSGNLLVSTFVHGIGQGSSIAFGPGIQSVLSVSVDGIGLNGPTGVEVDAAGDVFILDTGNNRVVEVPAGGSPRLVASDFSAPPYGLAVDGAGDVLVSLWFDGMAELLYLGDGNYGPGIWAFQDPNMYAGVAVDGAGDIFFQESLNGGGVGALYEALNVNGNYQSFVWREVLNGDQAGMAVDGSGDIFWAVPYGGPTEQNELMEDPYLGNGSYGTEITLLDKGLNYPQGVAVDGAGDLFVADVLNNRVLEVPAGCTSNTCQTTVGSGLSHPNGVAVDGAGDVFIADTNNNRVVEVQRSMPPMLSFPATLVDKKSSAQSVTVQNIGNQPLDAISPGLVVGPNFLQVNGAGKVTNCTDSFALKPGATCNLSIEFEPQVAGELTSTATFTDNALNTEPSLQQSIVLQGKGNPLTQTVSFTGAPATEAKGGTFTVVATTNAGITPTITVSGPCTAGPVYASGTSFDAVITMTKSTGTCTTKTEWPANDVYKAASATQKTTAS